MRAKVFPVLSLGVLLSIAGGSALYAKGGACSDEQFLVHMRSCRSAGEMAQLLRKEARSFEVSLVLYRSGDDKRSNDQWETCCRRVSALQKAAQQGDGAWMAELGALIKDYCYDRSDCALHGQMQVNINAGDTKTRGECAGCAAGETRSCSDTNARVVGLTLTITPPSGNRADWDRMLDSIAACSYDWMAKSDGSCRVCPAGVANLPEGLARFAKSRVAVEFRVRYSDGGAEGCKCGPSCDCASRYHGVCPCGVSSICGCSGSKRCEEGAAKDGA